MLSIPIETSPPASKSLLAAVASKLNLPVFGVTLNPLVPLLVSATKESLEKDTLEPAVTVTAKVFVSEAELPIPAEVAFLVMVAVSVAAVLPLAGTVTAPVLETTPVLLEDHDMAVPYSPLVGRVRLPDTEVCRVLLLRITSQTSHSLAILTDSALLGCLMLRLKTLELTSFSGRLLETENIAVSVAVTGVEDGVEFCGKVTLPPALILPVLLEIQRMVTVLSSSVLFVGL
jgi:hypothetical protein